MSNPRYPFSLSVVIPVYNDEEVLPELHRRLVPVLSELAADWEIVFVDDVIGDYCHLAPHACIGSYLKIGRGVHIGLNATIHENLTLGDCCALGMGAVLLNDMKDYEIWAGVPAKFLRMAKKEL